MEKYYRAGQVKDDNTAHAHFMLEHTLHTHTHTECVIHIVFPMQQCLHKRATMLHYTYSYTASLDKTHNQFPKRLEAF
jgi:hypothetical protein